LTLSSGDVHLWRAWLDVPAPRVRSLKQTLAGDELKRAVRFYRRRDRERFVVARGLLRAILGRYLDVQPEQLRFRYGSNGKPALIAIDGQDALSFSLSHSHGLALYGITRDRRIGIDVERVRADFAYDRIARRFFSPRECAALGALAPDVRHEAFFACWTRKEAYVKATGKGLSFPLKQFEISAAPREAAGGLSAQWASGEISGWWLQGLIPAPGYVAAVAVEGRDWRLANWQWRWSTSGLANRERGLS
jgi:4'-phosphopantetheinyl transferase